MRKPFHFSLKTPRVFIFLLVTLALSLQSYAAITTVTKQTVGHASTQEEALINALMESVQQVEGVNINTVRGLRSNLMKVMGVGAEGVTVNSINTHISAKVLGHIKGYVKSYDVISSEKTADGWKVTIKAILEQYKALAPERAGMRSIAVMPFRVIGAPTQNIAAQYLVDKIANDFTVDLTQSGKFRVLDRTYFKEYMSEIGKMASPLSNPREALKIGQKLGADYLLVGNVSYLGAEKKGQSYYGADFSTSQITGQIQYRLIEVGPQEIIWADTHDFSVQEKRVKDMLRDKTPSEAADIILTEATHSITTRILDGIYPIKVLNVNDANSILLNQGGKRLIVGQLFEVAGKSSSFVDPDTQLSISTDGATIATLKVTEVKPKYSVTKLIGGNLAKISTGSIVRRTSANEPAKDVPPPRVSPSSSDAPVDWSL
ncbi:MAG: CsgG/HfaB family protein [Candidatus Endonucleobacter sp. (ex Gigantidas childressi)]|nr:CsgG/HfaB family protein [Candidatus Endonucleobacter sp. (ex Gigantidas childressi)]